MSAAVKGRSARAARIAKRHVLVGGVNWRKHRFEVRCAKCGWHRSKCGDYYEGETFVSNLGVSAEFVAWRGRMDRAHGAYIALMSAGVRP